MLIHVVSLFPEMFRAVTEFGITRRAVEKGLLDVSVWNPRDYTTDKHQTVDDKPYGGGPGMLMKVEPLRDAVNAAKALSPEAPVAYLSPQGRQLDQQAIKELADLPELILVAGRYEGVDERWIEANVDMELSVGDFVVSGGELPAMLLVDGVTRLLPGVVGDNESVLQDSFYHGLLDYPQYTRPDEIDGQQVPEVLLSGDHKKIADWRQMQALGRTYERRPDLIDKIELSDDEQALLQQYLSQKSYRSI